MTTFGQSHLGDRFHQSQIAICDFKGQKGKEFWFSNYKFREEEKYKYGFLKCKIQL